MGSWGVRGAKPSSLQVYGSPTGVRGLAPGFVGKVRCLVRLVKGKFVAKVRMGGELGSPGAKPPGLGHSVQGGVRGLAPRFRPPRKRGVRGAYPPV